MDSFYVETGRKSIYILRLKGFLTQGVGVL